MIRILRRSLLQVVAAVVLFVGAGAAELFAGTTEAVAASTNGSSQSVVVYTLWRLANVNGIPRYVLQPVTVNGTLDTDGRMNLPLVNTIPMGISNMNNYIYGTTLTGLTSGTAYAVVCEVESGTAPNNTYSTIQTTYWVE